MNIIYMQAASILVGLVVGLWFRRLIRGAFILVALAGIAALALIAMGHSQVLEAQADLAPKFATIGRQTIEAIKQVITSAPGALVGLLLGVVIREVVTVVRS